MAGKEDNEIFPENFQILQDVPTIRVVRGEDNALVEFDNTSSDSFSTSTTRGTGTGTNTSRTSGTATHSVVNSDSLPEELQGKSMQHALADRDDDNSTDSDSDWDAVTDRDLTGDADDTIEYSDEIVIDPPFGSDRGIVRLK